ncbi:CHAP domain containing protein [Cellulophaga algicola DSM 14237]|uniref:CHAP domain containing protein n=1 Tax=Cellulophaga algicola (strain DSM 14237 / IC166 / ACAM 630) TaxID=688270 RepID=E6X9T7_CELAD|nr:CHAP domain-containing protein [Cellulophaga algicola]ADV49857.1 CHAP domain containing protein [Cellulophaga algicola DSM 14237]
MLSKFKKRIVQILGVLILLVLCFFVFKKINLNPNYEVGQEIDSLNGVSVYYNGGVGNVDGRELTKDGYNLGLKYQCVEFVKRYYYDALKHKMPDSYGHAKDFFNPLVKDGELNTQRNLNQFINPSSAKPRVNDLLVYSGTLLNKYGHVAIISNVTANGIEIIQQNPGPFGDSRENYILVNEDGKWRITNDWIIGWLRK